MIYCKLLVESLRRLYFHFMNTSITSQLGIRAPAIWGAQLFRVFWLQGGAGWGWIGSSKGVPTFRASAAPKSELAIIFIDSLVGIMFFYYRWERSSYEGQ